MLGADPKKMLPSSERRSLEANFSVVRDIGAEVQHSLHLDVKTAHPRDTLLWESLVKYGLVIGRGVEEGSLSDNQIAPTAACKWTFG
jgi:hypothetical protein